MDSEYVKVRAENDWTSAQVAQYPDRLTGFCGVNPVKDYALEEIDRCAADRYLRTGLKLHFGNSDVRVHDTMHVERLRRVFASANAHRMAIVVHMHANISNRRPYGRAEALIFLNQILPAVPDVDVQIAHLGGAGGYTDSTDAVLAVFTEPSKTGDPRTKRLYFDVSIGTTIPPERAPLIGRRIRELGIARVVYGSDTAPGDVLGPRKAWAAIRTLPLTEVEFQQIASNIAPYTR